MWRFSSRPEGKIGQIHRAKNKTYSCCIENVDIRSSGFWHIDIKQVVLYISCEVFREGKNLNRGLFLAHSENIAIISKKGAFRINIHA